LRHHLYNPDFKFVKEPAQFDKNSSKKLLQFCLGATLYTPGTKDLKEKLINENKLAGLTSLVLDCEDSISESDLHEAEENIISILEYTANMLDKGKLDKSDLPLLFIRVRNIDHFKQFSKKFSKQHLEIITGFNFPKFDTRNAKEYLNQLENLNNKYNKKLYGMPILESKELAYKEKRIHNLVNLKDIIQPYKKFILNIRVGATDFSSLFSLRRGINFSIYDLTVVEECLSDIINCFCRDEEGYVISGPVWEYFSSADNLNLNQIDQTKNKDLYSKLLKHGKLINKEIDGLLREIILDRLNGFIGKTIIHPSHIRYVNALQTVTMEEYRDARQIVSEDDGVIKSYSGNKMNEIKPHRSWAERTICRAQAYGVIENKSDYFKLMFKRKDQE